MKPGDGMGWEADIVQVRESATDAEIAIGDH